MATSIPASFIQNYVAKHGANNKFAQATSPTPAPASPPVTAPAASVHPTVQQSRNVRAGKMGRPQNTYRPAKKKPGFMKKIAGAIAGEVLKGTGHIGKHIVKRISEDAMGSGGVPTNNASSGAVAGLATSAQGSQGEPGVKSKRKTPLLTYKTFKRSRVTS